LARLVENVLSFARLEDGRHVAQMSDVPLPSLLQSVMERLEERSSIASMELVVSPLPDDDATITTSPVVVEQIMGNLVDNACKYGASPILVSCELTETEIIFQISDGGPGLEPEMKDRIFEPFDRGSRSGGDPSAGVGLGLSLSEELARDLGGTLLLTDPATATFTLSLPRSPA
jgi:signal transduction histidine kinase